MTRQSHCSTSPQRGPGSRCGLAAVLLTWVALPLAAQEGPVTLEFSFSNPGARSMALGGAFAALADDATAAFANPAGLVQLLEPEASVEGRSWSYETPFVAGGRASGPPSGRGIDTVAGVRSGGSSSDEAGLSFTSFVYPLEKVSLALYRHVWADFDLFSEVNGLFGVEDGEPVRSADVQTRARVRVQNFGAAAGYRLTPTVSVGLGVVQFRADVSSVSVEYAKLGEEPFGSNGFSPAAVDTTYNYQADDSGVVLHGGFLWRVAPRWSIGGFYREGPQLDLHVVEIVGPAGDEAPEGTVELDTRTPLPLPDVYGLGLAYRTADGRWAAGLEWSRVGYSSITDGLDAAVFDRGQIHVDDGDELRFGAERVFVRSRPIVALRFGAWRDPDHRVGSGPEADAFERAIFQSGASELHLSAGLGVVFARFQIDFGVDVSELVNVASLSFVYRF